MKCNKCGKPVKPENIVWLELGDDGRYYRKLPNNVKSKCSIAFGAKCAQKANS